MPSPQTSLIASTGNKGNEGTVPKSPAQFPSPLRVDLQPLGAVKGRQDLEPSQCGFGQKLEGKGSRRVILWASPSLNYEPLDRIVRTVRDVLLPAAAEMLETFVAPYDTGLLWNDLTDLKNDLQQHAEVPFFVAGSAAGVTSALTVGYVLWTIRSGWLVTSLLAQMPAWRLVDPLVVLDYLDEDSSSSKKKEDDDSLESLLERHEPKPEAPDEDKDESNKENLPV